MTDYAKREKEPEYLPTLFALKDDFFFLNGKVIFIVTQATAKTRYDPSVLLAAL